MKKKSHRITWKNLSYTYSYMWKKDKGSILQILGNAIASGIEPFVWVITPKLVIDELRGDANVLSLILILITALIIAATTSYFKAYYVGTFRTIMSRLRYKLGLKVHSRAMGMNFSKTESKEDQDLLKQALRTTTSPARGFGAVFQSTFLSAGYIVGFIGYTAILTQLHPLIFMYLLINVGIVHLLGVRAFKYGQSRRGELSSVERKSVYVASTMSDFQFGKDIRIYQLKDLLLGKKIEFDNQRVNIRKSIFKRELQRDIVDALLILVRDGIVYAYITYLVIVGQISIGSFMMYALSISGFANWVQQMMLEFAIINDACVYIDDFRNFVENKDDENNNSLSEPPKGRKLGIKVENLCFTYPGKENPIYNKLNLTINPGEKLAIVGVNGSGKTTLVKLLTGLYEPDAGDIKIDGISTVEMTKNDCYDLFSVVFQEIRPLAMSIKENVSVSKEVVNEEEVMAALCGAGIDKKVMSLPKGIDTPLLKVIEKEGLELSGGENQKIALARALYKNASIVILDEPTAALDPLAEKEIYENFNNMIGERTAIFISHRLSSTKFCDRIAFFEDGQIVEYGTHDELMALDGKYKAMFEIQSQYYQDVKGLEVSA